MFATSAGGMPCASSAARSRRTRSHVPASIEHPAPSIQDLDVIDVNALIGPYPFRFVPHPDPDVLERVLEREGLSGAWVGHLPSAFYRDPSSGNAQLYTALAPYAARLRPVPTIRPDWPNWDRALQTARDAGAAAVRVYPPQWQLGPGDARLSELAIACGEARLPLLLTVRFEDLR